MIAPLPRLTAVKLGGSLLNSGRLAATCKAIEAHGKPVAIIPGGGAFSDAVRAAQRATGIDDGAAHCMALLAMAQLAFAIAAASSRFAVVTSAADARRVLGAGKVPVWAPLDLVHDRTRVEESWRMTGDSLAVHHAGEIGASRLALVKSRPHDPQMTDLERCRAEELVDPLFPAMLDTSGIAAWWIGDGDAGRLVRFLDGDDKAAIRFKTDRR